MTISLAPSYISIANFKTHTIGAILAYERRKSREDLEDVYDSHQSWDHSSENCAIGFVIQSIE